MHDDDAPRPKQARITRHLLETWDVDDLHGYVEELRAEIGRAETEIARKTAKRQAAEAFFKPSS